MTGQTIQRADEMALLLTGLSITLLTLIVLWLAYGFGAALFGGLAALGLGLTVIGAGALIERGES